MVPEVHSLASWEKNLGSNLLFHKHLSTLREKELIYIIMENEIIYFWPKLERNS
jgi:predicted nucleotidyltransferase